MTDSEERLRAAMKEILETCNKDISKGGGTNRCWEIAFNALWGG